MNDLESRVASLEEIVARLISGPAPGGAWYNNTHFPEGTQFMATYKGQTYTASIRNGKWTASDGAFYKSPSSAARAISGTNVNGWVFWKAKKPTDDKWIRLCKLAP